MLTCLDDRMVSTRNGWAKAETSQANGILPPLPTLPQTTASILESRDEQTDLRWQLVTNSTRGGNGVRNTPALPSTTYSDFTTTHLPLFTEAGEPLKADHCLRAIEFKFRLLHCTKV
jgi:hypothetical protein